MSNDEFRAIVRSMRDAQRDYFRTRDHKYLTQSKELERLVDRELAEKPLFDREGREP